MAPSTSVLLCYLSLSLSPSSPQHSSCCNPSACGISYVPKSMLLPLGNAFEVIWHSNIEFFFYANALYSYISKIIQSVFRHWSLHTRNHICFYIRSNFPAYRPCSSCLALLDFNR